MKPIGQTFFVNEPPPPTGAAGIFLTRVDIYFKNVSSTYGIEMHIRTTENGVPTANRLPFGRKVIQVTDTIGGSPVIQASNDASVATPFIFDTPVFLESGKSYAFVVAPVGGTPDYEVWTGQISQNDVTTNAPIFTNNGSGDLFLSSNDIDWLPVINEDIKYILYAANFTSSQGKVNFITPAEDRIYARGIVGGFLAKERIYFSNNIFNICVANITSLSGSFSAGDTVYQNTATSNVSGILYGSNSTVLKIKNTTGSFAPSLKIYDANNVLANATISALSQNVITTANSTVMSVPDSSFFTSNQVIFVATNNRSMINIRQVTGVTNSTAITLSSNVSFSETAAFYGDIFNPNSAPYLSSTLSPVNYDMYYAILDSVSSNPASPSMPNNSCILIGGKSGASAYKFLNYVNLGYNSLTPSFSYITPSNTSLNWFFKGVDGTNNHNQDSSYSTIVEGQPNEFTDKVRSLLSHTSEILLPLGHTSSETGTLANVSVIIQANVASTNPKISPVIDTIQRQITTTYNNIANTINYYGYYCFSNNNGYIPPIGSTISQNSFGNTTTGTVVISNTTGFHVISINGKFISNTAFSNGTSNVGFINTVQKYGEFSSNTVYYFGSRYISKNVLLAQGQDSEDIRTYLTAYRPANTNLYVYAKIMNSHDPDQFGAKDWSRLQELSSPGLQSSSVDINDRVELVYGFPQAQIVFSNSVSVSNSSTTITVPSTANFTNNSFIYLASNTSAFGTFNVREVVFVVNSTALTVDRAPSFSNTNAIIGQIPGIESTAGAFLCDISNNIVRYVTNNDSVFDSYLQFAIKVAPIASTSALVPRVKDIRCLALQV